MCEFDVALDGRPERSPGKARSLASREYFCPVGAWPPVTAPAFKDRFDS